MTLEAEVDYVALAKSDLRTRRQRNLYFSNSQIFGDPAWELVLEAYIATIERRCIALSDLKNALRRSVPVITRLAAILESEGYLEKCPSENNQSSGGLQLTNEAVDWIVQC